MTEVATQNTGIVNQEERDMILLFEVLLAHNPDATWGDTKECPLEHYFTDGVYSRKFSAKKGTKLTGKVHLHDHPNFLVKGKVQMYTEFGGLETLEAPCFMISKAGTKRAIYVLEDVEWVTIHANPTNTQDLIELEKAIIAPNYEAFDQHKLGKETLQIPNNQ